MYDQTLVLDLLDEMIEACKKVEKRCSNISDVDGFLTEEGQIILDSICMQLIAIGEAVKKVDAITDKKLFSHYPSTNWKAIAAMRDILSHHYFDLNAETVYGVCQDDIAPLRKRLEEIRQAMQKSNE
jgi:uncharacterized protein with HEPN domain